MPKSIPYDKLPDFNVMNFGAVGDGATNDTVAIQAAIDAASIVGGTVIVPPKPFKVTTLNMKRQVNLQGMSTRGTNEAAIGSRIIGTAGLDTIVLPTNDILVRDMSIKGLFIELPGASGGVGSCIRTGPNSNSFLIEDCMIHCASGYACVRLSGDNETFTMRHCNLWGGLYGLTHDGTINPGSGTANFDRVLIDRVHIGYQSKNNVYIKTDRGTYVTWIAPIFWQSLEHAVVTDGPVQDWLFLGANWENVGWQTTNVQTTGSITSGTATLTVAAGQGANFAVGNNITVVGAGALSGFATGLDHYATVSSKAGDVLTLSSNASRTVTNARVTNANWDCVNYQNTWGGAGPKNQVYVGCSIGDGAINEGGVRYAVNAYIVNGCTFVGCSIVSPKNVYDPQDLCVYVGPEGSGLKVKAGVPTLADFRFPFPGQTMYDHTNNRLYVISAGGVLKSVALT